MPRRDIPIVGGEIYHVMNRAIGDSDLFLTSSFYKRFLYSLEYYNHLNPPVRYSKLFDLSASDRSNIWEQVTSLPRIVDVLAYCLMPNHFHLVVRPHQNESISIWLGKANNSFSKSYNLLNKRKGPLCQHRFKAVPVFSQEQLIHTIRYVHINPAVAGLIPKQELDKHLWSSYPEYVGAGKSILVLDKEHFSECFKSKGDLESFTLDQIDYARSLKDYDFLGQEQS